MEERSQTATNPHDAIETISGISSVTRQSLPLCHTAKHCRTDKWKHVDVVSREAIEANPGLRHTHTHTQTSKDAKHRGTPKMFSACTHHRTSLDQTNDTLRTKKGTEGQTNRSIRWVENQVQLGITVLMSCMLTSMSR